MSQVSPLLLHLYLLQACAVLGTTFPSINSSTEFKLRKTLFAQYDRMVRPVLMPSDVVNVSFELQLKAIIEVNNKEQVITTDTLVSQKWNNPFLQWDPSLFDEIRHILVSPDEVWVPDIVLENNGDGKILQAGHLEKFRSFVLIDHSGQNEWFSPATFKSTCNLNVKFFPFDKQDCRMVFRSLTADESFMEIRTKNTESDDPEEDLKLTTSNGYWSLRAIKVNTGEYSRGRRRFREVVVSFSIGRKPTHFVLFSLVPCMIIGMLILVSFFIPAESGERIGLCATILLAVSVYLLVVTEQLPEQSDSLPLIGVYYIVIMFEIGLALAATVLVLMAHHATFKPPNVLKYLTVFNRISFFKKDKPAESSRVSSPTPEVGVRNIAVTEDTLDVELGDVEKSDTKADSRRPSTAITILAVDEDAKNQEIWREIGRALDRMFFWAFLVLFVVSSIAIYGQAGRL